MSLEKIEQYIKDLEALKNYERIKEERDVLLTKVKELEAKLSTEMGEVEKLRRDNENLRRIIEAKTREVKDLESMLKAREDEIKELKSRVKELEELKALAEGKTLKEAEKLFLKSMERKIREEAEKLFHQMWEKWEKEDKPREVRNELLKRFKYAIRVLSKPYLIDSS